MHRVGVSTALLVAAIVIAALGATRASAFPGAISPQIPGVGSPSALTGPGPQIEVSGGSSWLLRRSQSTWVEVRCSTSTGNGCSGVLELIRSNSPVRSAAFELPEGESEGIHVSVPRELQRLARRPAGTSLVARACATDSLGRAECDSAGITLHSRGRR